MSRSLICTALALCASVALAAPGRVEMVQPPASVDEDGQRRPLEPGAALDGGDLLRVGESGRLRLHLAEGSGVKIGSAARVRLARLRAGAAAGERGRADGSSDPGASSAGDAGRAEPGATEGQTHSRQGGEVAVTETAEPGVFSGLLEILSGAFRFTTDPSAADRKRDIEFKVGPVMTGIRGTDIWGKAASDRQFVVLLEGTVDVRVDSQTGQLTQPGTAVVAPSEGQPQIGVAIDRETIQRFARETEPVEGQARLVVDGPWRVIVDSVRERKRAQQAMRRYRRAGYPAEVTRAQVDGERWYRVAIPGAATRAGAAALGQRFESEFGVEGTWVTRRP